MSATNSVLSNDTSITLDWADVSGANKYQVQVSVDRADFGGTLMVDDNTLVASTKSFTDTGTDNLKRFWRWRYSTNAGTSWSEWSEVGSYWLLAAASADITLSSNKWSIINPSDMTDTYTLTTFPVYRVTGANIYRIQQRNRLGTLLSEYVTKKDQIELRFDPSCYMSHEQYRCFRRFHETVKTFFLAAYKSNEVDTVPHIWKVQLVEDPQMTMIASGRQGLMTGTLTFTEV